MTLTTIITGSFDATGNNIFLNLPSGVEWIEVYNLTQAAAAQTVAVGVRYYWQFGFGRGSKLVTFKSNAANAANLEQFITTNGFFLADTADNFPGVRQNTVTAISTAAIPVVTAAASNLAANSIVRLYNVAGAIQLGGIDFTVGNNTLTANTFSLDYLPELAIAGTNGGFAVIPYDPIYYPTHRYVTEITQAVEAVVTFSVTHGYQVGQILRFTSSQAYGMFEINDLEGTILAIDTNANTVTVDINTSSFTAFTFPGSVGATSSNALGAFSPALAVPLGMDTAAALSSNVNILSDATLNTGAYGLILAGGVNCPGGALNDVIFWRAGTSFNG